MEKTTFTLCGFIVLIGLLLSFQIFRAKKNIGPSEIQTEKAPLTEKEVLENQWSDLNLELEQKKSELTNANLELGNLRDELASKKFTPQSLKNHKAKIENARIQKINLKIAVKTLETKLKELKEKEEQTLKKAIPFIEE